MLFFLYGMWLLYSQQSYKQKVHSRNGHIHVGMGLSSRFSGHTTFRLLPAFTTLRFNDYPTPTGEIIDTRTRKIHATHVGPTKILLVVHTHCISPQPSIYLPHKPSSPRLSNLGICFWSQAYLTWDPLSDRLVSKVWSGKSTTESGHWLDPTNGFQHFWKIIYKNKKIKIWFILGSTFSNHSQFPTLWFCFWKQEAPKCNRIGPFVRALPFQQVCSSRP